MKGFVYDTGSEDIVFYIEQGQTMRSKDYDNEINVEVDLGTKFTYLGVDCIVTDRKRLCVDEDYCFWGYEYVDKRGLITSGSISFDLINKLIRQGKIVING